MYRHYKERAIYIRKYACETQGVQQRRNVTTAQNLRTWETAKCPAGARVSRSHPPSVSGPKTAGKGRGCRWQRTSPAGPGVRRRVCWPPAAGSGETGTPRPMIGRQRMPGAPRGAGRTGGDAAAESARARGTHSPEDPVGRRAGAGGAVRAEAGGDPQSRAQTGTARAGPASGFALELAFILANFNSDSMESHWESTTEAGVLHRHWEVK